MVTILREAATRLTTAVRVVNLRDLMARTKASPTRLSKDKMVATANQTTLRTAPQMVDPRITKVIPQTPISLMEVNNRTRLFRTGFHFITLPPTELAMATTLSSLVMRPRAATQQLKATILKVTGLNLLQTPPMELDA